MNDRDRLAADLCLTLETHTHTEVDGVRHGRCLTAATTLITLGWTRRDDPLSPQWEACKVCGGDHWTKDHPDLGLPPEKQGPMPPDRTLDEERLARALIEVDVAAMSEEIHEWWRRGPKPLAAAIAKAYREDTDA